MARLSDLIMPNPQVFPACSEKGCGAPYVLRRGHAFDGKKWTEEWAWFRDCKHKKAEAKMVDLRRKVRKRRTVKTKR